MRSERILGASRVLAFSTIIAAMFTTAVAATHEIVLYRFAGGNDGEYADTELVRDHAGNLYGTTVQGGTGSGTVFQLTPAGVHNVLYSFMGGSDGAEPYKGVTLGHDGSLLRHHGRGGIVFRSVR